MKKPNRREFLKNSLLTSGFLGLSACSQNYSKTVSSGELGSTSLAAEGYGPLLSDPDGRLKLPKGFSYKAISERGARMDDGQIVPPAHDGMATFPGPNGLTLIVRNHEVSPLQEEKVEYLKSSEWKGISDSKRYDSGSNGYHCTGGTTTLVFDTRTQELKRHYLSLTGTIRNCSGGVTPWGSWITCEENVNRANDQLKKDHGYNFEAPANYEIGLADPVPLKEMGRFNHEAVSVDPASGVVYQTEDRPDGLIYRFIPNIRGQLAQGGRLQALVIKGAPSSDTRNWEEIDFPSFPVKQSMEVEWIDIDDPAAPNDDLRYKGFENGAARFARGEGMFYGNGEIYFACTNGGPKKLGQIFRYRPSTFEGMSKESTKPGKLELFIESQDLELLKACDNLTVAPWGDIIICEDDNESSTIVGITNEGKMYKIGHVQVKSEVAGACFSPDGTTLFVNIQNSPGETLAITGPWRDRIA